MTEQPPQVPQESNGQLQELVNVAFSQGPEQAIEQARKTGSPAILDALHDALAEPTVRAELEKRGKVAPAA